MVTEHRFTIEGSDDRPVQMKYLLPDQITGPFPVIISHGFKGFMDWGHFPYAGRRIAEAGNVVVMFNYSHNGTTPESPAEFADLELFGRNTYSRELYDLGKVMDEVESSETLRALDIDTGHMILVGHSRGGGITIVKASEDQRVVKLVSWAPIGSFGAFFGPDEPTLAKWREEGVLYTLNSRTQQYMPLYYSLYEDVLNHPDRLNIPKAVKKLNIPWLILQGTADPTIPYTTAQQLKTFYPAAELVLVEGAHHNFGGKHPMTEEEMNHHTHRLIEETIRFIRQ